MRKIAMFVLLVMFSTMQVEAVMGGTSCMIISVTGGGRVIRGDRGIGETLKEGDVLRATDRIQVPSGAVVDIAFDERGMNIIRLEGQTDMLISQMSPTRLELKRGSVLSLLDDKRTSTKFQITTPTSVCAVRGTHFQANYSRGVSEFSCTRGYLRISGIDSEGRLMKDSVFVQPGQKTQVKSAGKAPEPVQAMTAQESAAFKTKVRNFAEVRVGMDDILIQEWDRATAGEKPEKEKSPFEGAVIY